MWPWWPPLTQKCQKHFVVLADRLWRKQTEVSNPMPVMIRDLICNEDDELTSGAGGDDRTLLLIFGQKTGTLRGAPRPLVVWVGQLRSPIILNENILNENIALPSSVCRFRTCVALNWI